MAQSERSTHQTMHMRMDNLAGCIPCLPTSAAFLKQPKLTSAFICQKKGFDPEGLAQRNNSRKKL